MLEYSKVRTKLARGNERDIVGSSSVFINDIKELRRLVFRFLFRIGTNLHAGIIKTV